MKSELIPMMIRTQFLQWAVLCLAVSMAGFYLLVRPVILSLKSLKHTQTDLETLILKTQVTSNLKDLDALMENRQQELQTLENQILHPGEQAKVISMLTRVMQDLSIYLVHLEPAKEGDGPTANPKKGGVAPHEFNLEMETGYRTLGTFFETLEPEAPKLKVQKLSLKQHPSNSEMLKAQMSLVAYEEPGAP